jgi:uncharacterized membrane protein
MNQSTDIMPLTTDLLWPWSIPNIGMWALIITAILLVAAAAWSYLRVPGAKLRRVGVVLGLRIFALFLVFLAITGASCISRDELKVPSLLIIAIDRSASMSVVKDEIGGLSRWDYLKQNLNEIRPLLDRLKKDHNISVAFWSFGDEVAEFDIDNPGEALGKWTDTAQMLETLKTKYRGEKYLRALLVLSDGADNQAPNPPARDLAAQWHSLPCPVHTFAYGNKAVVPGQNDIVVTSLTPESSTVSIKGKLTVKATIDALGFTGSPVRVKVFIDDKEVAAQDEVLNLRKDNVVSITCDAPAVPGEIKVTLKVHGRDRPGALPGELSEANNEMATYVTVTREGLSVLLIDRQEHFPEPQRLLAKLDADKRFRVYRAWLRGPNLLTDNQVGLFQFDKQPYDVIILGEVTAERLRAADPDALKKIYDRVVNKRTGLLMMGGRYAFANGDWAGTEMEKLLPMKLDTRGKVEGDIKLKPTAKGLEYVLRLADREKESAARWELLQSDQEETPGVMRGMTRLGTIPGDKTILAEATTEKGEVLPLMVAHTIGTGRVIAFGGATTYNWETPGKADGPDIHSRFWRQVVVWLAQQENTNDNLRIRLNTRRLRTGDNLGFGVELKGTQGETLRDVKYNVKVVDPKGNETVVEVRPGLKGSSTENESRGDYKPKLPGEYRVVASGSGKHPTEDRTVSGNSEARFLAYQDDAETTEQAANPDFLKDLARDGGGRDYRPGELKKFLEHLPSKPLPKPPPKPSKLPDWRTNKGPSPFLLAFFLLFVQVVALEWFLRRRWGMV